MKYSRKEFSCYSDLMNAEQMRVACHISKRTVQYLLRSNLIPHTTTGKKTRCYQIKKKDIIAFMNDREVNPDKYIAPKGWYGSMTLKKKAYMIRILPEDIGNKEKLRKFYEKKLASYPDVMSVSQVVAFTGYNRRTVNSWVRLGKVFAIILPQRQMIPKASLVDWLCSDDCNNTHRKTKEHIELLWEMHEGRWV